MTRHRGNAPLAIDQSFSGARAGYNAANRAHKMKNGSRNIPLDGASADFHYANESDYIWIAEMAREFDRNDVNIRHAVNKVTNQVIGKGFTPEPMTGSKELDALLKDLWLTELENDPKCLDHTGRLTFSEMQRLVCRDELLVGDCFAMPTTEDKIQLIESHRARSPSKSLKNKKIIHGVELDGDDRVVNYWFTKEPRHEYGRSILKRDLKPYKAYDHEGNALVWHIIDRDRLTENRGISKLAPVFDHVAMHNDLQYAQLVRARISACMALIEERPLGYKASPAEMEADARKIGEAEYRFEPGQIIKMAPGVTARMESPNVPNDSFFNHVDLLLTFICNNLGLPLCMFTMDASETNFSGFRGAVQQAREGFRHRQQNLIGNFHTPLWRWRVNIYADRYPELAKVRETGFYKGEKVNLYRHKWTAAKFRYIDPQKDSATDSFRLANGMVAHRNVCDESGQEAWPILLQQIIDDNEAYADKAIEAAKRLNSKHGLVGAEAVSWRELGPQATAEGLTMSMLGNDPQASKTEPKQTKKEAKK